MKKRTIEIKAKLTEEQYRALRLAIAKAVLKIDKRGLVWLIDAPK
jgi:hypothetical protein